MSGLGRRSDAYSSRDNAPQPKLFWGQKTRLATERRRSHPRQPLPTHRDASSTFHTREIQAASKRRWDGSRTVSQRPWRAQHQHGIRQSLVSRMPPPAQWRLCDRRDTQILTEFTQWKQHQPARAVWRFVRHDDFPAYFTRSADWRLVWLGSSSTIAANDRRGAFR